MACVDCTRVQLKTLSSLLKGQWDSFYQLRWVLAKGKHSLQILLKALFSCCKEARLLEFFPSLRNFDFTKTLTNYQKNASVDFQTLIGSDIIENKQKIRSLKLCWPCKILLDSFVKVLRVQHADSQKINQDCKSYEIQWKVWETHGFGVTICYP